jgi:energy-coupling factor transporter ATP-binding protein EcfA2
MYISTIEITNLRAIKHVLIDLKSKPGWHVLLGDNGSGKSTVVRAISLALIGPSDSKAIRINPIEWLRSGEQEGNVILEILMDKRYDRGTAKRITDGKKIHFGIEFIRNPSNSIPGIEIQERKIPQSELPAKNYNWSNKGGWFGVAYGPFRRFTGGNRDWDRLYLASPRAGAYLSAFGEDVALTEPLDWLKSLHVQRLEANTASVTIDGLRQLINSTDFLPHGARMDEVDSEGIFFIDGNQQRVSVTQLSDGYRSVLSFMFELVRQLIRVYGEELVFDAYFRKNTAIDLPGVVIVDEIDSHLHPTWQTRIAEWFTNYFPKLQFIITTHSPLICRGAEKGSIWKLPKPGEEQHKGLQIEGVERDRLLYGNVLDAYGTELFGKDITRSAKGHDKRKIYQTLLEKSIVGETTSVEEKKLIELRPIFATDIKQ